MLDETSGMCIGYTVAQAPGLWQIYDAQGHFVRLEEAPLETPLFDPTDIATDCFCVFRILRTGRALFEAVRDSDYSKAWPGIFHFCAPGSNSAYLYAT
ncbi:hypothetical protein [Pantoea sp. SGAir0180]